jgi:hypothetical protein
LIHAIARCFELHRSIGAIAVIVDAKGDDALAIYQKHEVRRFLDDEYRLFLPMATAGDIASLAYR